MTHTLHSLSLKGKKIVNIENGKIVAEIQDVLFNPDTNSIAALVTSKAGLFRRTTELVEQKDIQLFGHDVVLSKTDDIVKDKSAVTGADHWLQVSDQLNGISVITSEGTRVGKLTDLVVDEKGKVQSLFVSDINTNKTEEVPSSALQSIGKDAIIVDPNFRPEPELDEPAETPVYQQSNVGVFTPQHQDSEQIPPEPMDQKDFHKEEHEG